MRNRIESMLGRPVGGMWVGTFHGLAHWLLRTHWRDADLREDFRILGSEDQLRRSGSSVGAIRARSSTARIGCVRRSERRLRLAKNEWIISRPERRMSGTQKRRCEEGERR